MKISDVERSEEFTAESRVAESPPTEEVTNAAL